MSSLSPEATCVPGDPAALPSHHIWDQCGEDRASRWPPLLVEWNTGGVAC